MSAHPTPPHALQALLDAPEGRRLEFKAATRQFHFEHLLEYCVGLANGGGGTLVLGATDRRPRRICGTAAFEEPGRTEAGVYERLGHRVRIEEVLHAEGRVLLVHVPGRRPGTAWHVGGRYLTRAGDGLHPLSEEELRAIFTEDQPDFSAEPCPGARLTDLSTEALAVFQARWARQSRDPRKLTWTAEDVLAHAELLVDGTLTHAALLLFGTPTALNRLLPQAEVVFEYRPSEASGPAADRQEYRQGFLGYQERLWERINLRNDRQTYQEGLFRVDIPTFDEAVVREALLNAVAHRDYRLGGSIFLRQFARRLEVVSPGGFPPGITVENLLDQQNPRNRRLAEALSRCGLIERSGQGVNLMVERAIRQGKPAPDYTASSDHDVRLLLRGEVHHPGLIRFLERLGDARLETFSTQDFQALACIHQDQPLPPALAARLPGLLEAGAVESLGRGRGRRLVLSRALHVSMGAAGVHTRKRGLDHETNKALLLQHLRSQAEAGAPLAELSQVLPALPGHHLRRLLQELRREGKVRLEGARRWARWRIEPI